MRFRPRSTVLPLRALVMASLLVGDHSLGNAADVDDVLARQLAPVDEVAAEVPLALAGLVAVEVALAGLTALQQARGGDAEALLRSLMALHLGHGSTSFRKRKAEGGR